MIEAQLSMQRRLGMPEEIILQTQGDLATTYQALERDEEAMRVKREVYSGYLKFYGEEHERTLLAARNYATGLAVLERHGEAKSLVRSTLPVARRVLGENGEITLLIRQDFATMLYEDDHATLDDLREAVTMFEDLARIARRVFGGTHPKTEHIEDELREARAALRAREATPPSA